MFWLCPSANKLVPRGLVFGCLYCILNGIYSEDT